MESIDMLRYYSTDFLSYNLYSLLNKITVPTLIIRGEYDISPLESDKKIQENILLSELVEIKDCGHFPFVEKKQEF
jgi:pimeloyl-ACP methyl ester carboxylesterase